MTHSDQDLPKAPAPSPRYPQANKNTIAADLRAAFAQYVEDGWVTDWLHVVKSGKEAEVHCCRAAPKHDDGCFALKVYKPAGYRSFKNNAQYTEGRIVDPGSGRPDRRLGRALRRKRQIGRRLESDIWTRTEFALLAQLHSAGANVPKPIATYGPTILMQFVGEDSGLPAPMLADVQLDPSNADRILKQILRNIRLLLRHEIVHGDLSAYNILLWHDRPVIIDLPQAIDCRTNGNGYSMLCRDLHNVMTYFSGADVGQTAATLAEQMWQDYQLGDL